VFNSTDTALVAMASRTIRILNILLPILPLQIMATSFFQAINQPVKAAFLSLSRQVLLVIPLVLILPLFFALDGVFYAPVAADLIATLLAVYMLHHFFAKHNLRLFGKAKN